MDINSDFRGKWWRWLSTWLLCLTFHLIIQDIHEPFVSSFSLPLAHTFFSACSSVTRWPLHVFAKCVTTNSVKLSEVHRRDSVLREIQWICTHKADLTNYCYDILIEYFRKVYLLGNHCGSICSSPREKARKLVLNSMLQTSIGLLVCAKCCCYTEFSKTEIHHFFKGIYREEDLTKAKYTS